MKVVLFGERNDVVDVVLQYEMIFWLQFDLVDFCQIFFVVVYLEYVDVEFFVYLFIDDCVVGDF